MHRTAEIAKLIRNDIKAAVKAGKLPTGIKVSVTTDTYSMGSSIRVSVRELPAGYPLHNPARIAYVLAHGFTFW
jgi:hypothetical protein